MELETAIEVNYTVEERNHCSNCGKDFDKPKIIQYCACPHCLTKIEEKKETGCKYWFGYLSQKEKTQSVPQECIECEKVVDCMLNRYATSPSAVKEIKKWY